MASDILSYNVVQDHEGISIKGYRGLRPPGDLICYSSEVYEASKDYCTVRARLLYGTRTAGQEAKQ